MMKKLRRAYVLHLLMACLLISGSISQTACSEKQLKQVAEAAKDIGGGTRDVIKAVTTAYQQGLITIEQKDKFADLLKAIAKGGQHGVDAIEALQKAGVTTLSRANSKALSLIFDTEVVTPFLSLLQELGQLSDAPSIAIRTALASVRTAIVLLSARIGRVDVIRAIQVREVWNA